MFGNLPWPLITVSCHPLTRPLFLFRVGAAAASFSRLLRGCHDGDSEGRLSLDRILMLLPRFCPLWGTAQMRGFLRVWVVATEASCLKPSPCLCHLVRGGPCSLPPTASPLTSVRGARRALIGVFVAAESSCVGPWLTRIKLLVALHSRLWQHLMGDPGQRSRGACRRCHLDSLIGVALIWLMSEVEPPHWLQRDTRITERDCRRGERTLNLCHILLPKWLPSWGVLWHSCDLQSLFSESVGDTRLPPPNKSTATENSTEKRDGVDLGMTVPRVFTSTRLSHRILPLCKIPPFEPYYLFYCVSYIHIFSPLLDVNSLRTEFSFSSLAVSVTCRPLAVPHPHPTGCLAPVGGVWNGRWK